MAERNEIRISIARAVHEFIEDEEQTTVTIAPDLTPSIGAEPPKIHHIPCVDAAVVWYEYLGPSEHEALDCRVTDGTAAAAELLTEYVDEMVTRNPEQTVPLHFDGPDDDIEEIVSAIDLRSNFYEIER